MEDVRHLLQNAKEESYLFLVDSRARDTAVYPTPSHYEISFASPFRNVFGLDLLDATVARTEYIVESNTNVLEFAMGQPTSAEEWGQGGWAAGRRRSVALQPGDYNLPQFVEALNAVLSASAVAYVEPPITVMPLTNPSEISNKIGFVCSQPFTLLMAGSTLRHTLGFGDPVVTASSASYAAVPGWSLNRSLGASATFLSKPSALGFLDMGATVATVGPVPAGPAEEAGQFQEITGDLEVRQYFVSQAAGPAGSCTVYLTLVGSTPRQLTVQVCRASDDQLMGSGSLVVESDVNDAYAPRQCALTPVASQLMESGTAYYVKFTSSAPSGSCPAVYYNEDNLPQTDARHLDVHASGGAVLNVTGQTACCDVAVSAWGHAVVCPGVVNLTGPRYVNIRCPEIESHMFRDRVNEACHAGLGMVQLRGYGFREQRFDFVSFPPRRFHPLGKLTKLSFRLERPDGTLYDSHGVDHTLLLVLKYYRIPTGADDAAQNAQSVLNPSYVPDLREYMIRHHWAEEARATDRTAKRY